MYHAQAAANTQLLVRSPNRVLQAIQIGPDLTYIPIIYHVSQSNSRRIMRNPSSSFVLVVAVFLPIDLSPFYSGIAHWRNIRDQSRFIQPEKGQPSYSAEQVREIVENILLFQRRNGGWPKDYDMTAVLTDEQETIVKQTRDNDDTSYDNGNIHSQVEYLAKAYHQVAEPSWRAACERGFDFMISSQYANGGFPQRFPNPKSYHGHITFNDGVMVGIVRVLEKASNGKVPFEWLDENRRMQAKRAVELAIDCMLKSQILVDGQRTGWCQQHDASTLEARPARTFELASICPQETTEIVHFLMLQSDPSPAIVEAVTAAVGWLKEVSLSGIRLEKVASPRETFLRHTADFDMVVIADAQAPPLWARHYEVGTNRPIFAGRDGIKKYALAEIERERRTGTAWYGGWPRDLINDKFSKWLAQHLKD
jgi:PelA/Pel-15E family pectate lyase